MRLTLIKRIIREEIDNVLNEFYHGSYALGGHRLTKFINDLDRLKSGSNKSIDELINTHFPKVINDQDMFGSIYLVIQNFEDGNITLRETLKELRELGLLRGN